MRAVPDMTGVDTGPRDGVQTFFYTNQQSARMMFYHDHAWGTTRLNVMAGAAAGYLISDDTEKALINSGTIPGAIDTIPLVVQDRTFVPSDAQMYDVKDANGNIVSYGQDPTWNKARWGGKGSFWVHHVYMPAQNPGDPGGMSAYGRWMYGPWFWPPAAATTYGPIANPYFDPNCNLDVPATWTYQTDPFCEPQQIPGTPNISNGMEQFNDTPIVNGVAYPKVTLQPKTYRFRILSAANDRFFNFQWYIADPSTGTLSEVALNPAELAAAQTDPVVFPTPVQGAATAGPDWIHIGSEGGFLPAPAVVDGQQPTTWITDPTRFDVGNVDLHSLLLAPAERADVIVDFSRFAGKTLILYNDAPAAFPARVPSYDYYTGQPDLSPNGAPGVLPGYGPNTRTIMQVTIANNAPAAAFNLTKLKNAFLHKADGSGVFESGQHPIIVGQAAYNSAYGTNFAASSNCNPIPNDPNPAFQICDGLVRVNDTMTFGFNTLKKQTLKTIDAAPAQGHPRRDERHDLRRVRPHAGQPGRRGAAADAGHAERHLLSVREPGDGAHRRHQSAEEHRDLRCQRQCRERSQDHADDRPERRVADLADHAQRGRHAPHPLPPLRRPAPEPGHLGQHHHPHGGRRARLEGHGAHRPAGRHHRRPAAGRARGPVGGAQLDPQPQPDGPGRLDEVVQQRRCPRHSDGADHEPARQLRRGVRLALPHPVARRDGHDAPADAGDAAGRAQRAHDHAHRHGEPLGGRADLERQLHHRDRVRGAAVDRPRQHLDQHQRPSSRRSISRTSTRSGPTPTP